MQVDEATWAEVRLANTAGRESLKAIAARLGLTPQRIGLKARREGWTRGNPEEKHDLDPALRRPRRRNAGGLPTRGAQKAVIARLYRAITLKLEHMEMRMASGETRSAQDEERESRALATLINNFEKVTEAVAGLDRERQSVRAASRAGTDAERMRHEITERLERLGGGRPAPAEGDHDMTSSLDPGGEGKWWGHSLTIWGTIVTVLSTVLPALAPVTGVDVTGDMIKSVGRDTVEAVQAIGALLGTLMTIYGRVRASQPIQKSLLKRNG
jgi:hypothetical protein